MEVFKVIIAGSRDFNNYEYLKQKCDTLLENKRKTHEIIIVSGGAKGADTLGERYAKERGYKILIFQPQWKTYGRSAGIRRNNQMADAAQAAIIFWDGSSKGSKNMADCMKSRSKTYFVFEYDNTEIVKEQ